MLREDDPTASSGRASGPTSCRTLTDCTCAVERRRSGTRRSRSRRVGRDRLVLRGLLTSGGSPRSMPKKNSLFFMIGPPDAAAELVALQERLRHAGLVVEERVGRELGVAVQLEHAAAERVACPTASPCAPTSRRRPSRRPRPTS